MIVNSDACHKTLAWGSSSKASPISYNSHIANTTIVPGMLFCFVIFDATLLTGVYKNTCVIFFVYFFYYCLYTCIASATVMIFILILIIFACCTIMYYTRQHHYRRWRFRCLLHHMTRPLSSHKLIIRIWYIK